MTVPSVNGAIRCVYIAPKPQPSQQQIDAFWDFIQKVSLLAGLALTLRSLSE
jgi:hypothetical protein